MLGKAYIALQTLVVGLWTLKMILMKCDEDGNNEHVGSWRKGGPCYKVTKNLAELSSSVL